MVPQNYETEITALSNAANRFLWNFTDELCSAGNKIIRLSYLGIPIEASLKKELMEEKGDLNYIWRTKRVWGGIWNCHRALKSMMKFKDLEGYKESSVIEYLRNKFGNDELLQRVIWKMFSREDLYNLFTDKQKALLLSRPEGVVYTILDSKFRII